MKLTKKLLAILCCPNCGGKVITPETEDNLLLCQRCHSEFPVVANCPVMLQRDNAVFHPDAYKGPAKKKIKRFRGWVTRLIPDPSVNLSKARVLARLNTLLPARKPASILVIGSGDQRSRLEAQISTREDVQVICSDIDIDADVDLFCDAHDLPFINDSIDAVIATVVLEHVLCPERVAAEIHRVLRPGGLLYSEMPFMQQVHEGAYDFTRYSLSGHRRLFNRFSEVESGMAAGPATVLVWSIENFVLAFVSRRILRLFMKALIRLVFAWIKYLDYFLEKRPEAMDGASCTYFLGAKMHGQVTDAEIIARYTGAKHLHHV